jgi:hypothetical protein
MVPVCRRRRRPEKAGDGRKNPQDLGWFNKSFTKRYSTKRLGWRGWSEHFFYFPIVFVDKHSQQNGLKSKSLQTLLVCMEFRIAVLKLFRMVKGDKTMHWMHGN